MKEYIKPIIEEELIEIADVIAVSGPTDDPLDIVTGSPEGEDL